MSVDDTRKSETSLKGSVGFAKRQHFVPEMMQRHFVGENGRLWYYDRRRRDGIGQTGPGNLSLESHLYTLENDEGDRFNAVDALLTRVESDTAPTLELLIDNARRGFPPTLSDEQRWALVLFMYLQHKRVPDFFRNVPRQKSMTEELADVVARVEAESGPMAPEVRETYLSSATAKRLDKNFKALGVVGDFMNSKTFVAFNSRGTSLAVIDQPGSSFILGSFPIFRSSTPSGTSLEQPEVELWMPIAPDVAIGLGGAQHERHLIRAGKGRKIAEMNNYIRDRSSVIASPSQYLVEVLSKKMTGPTVWQQRKYDSESGDS